MNYKLLHESDGQKTLALIFETGDEVMAGLARFAKDQKLRGSHLTAIGAFQQATLAYFDWETKAYQEIPVAQQVEVVSLVGDIAVGPTGEPKVHVHVVLGKRDGAALGGHLLRAVVRPTLEVVITESPKHLERRHDPESGLTLIRGDDRA